VRILWITNTIFPEPCKAIGLSYPVVGGWMFALAKQLISTKKIKLAIATVYRGSDIKSFDIEDVLYFLLPAKSMTDYHKNHEPDWQKICKEFDPDIIHIHGTEYPHGLECMRSCPTMNYIVSIQGLVGVYSKYYLGGIEPWEIFKHMTFRDFVRRDSLFQAKRKFENRSIFEKEYFLRSRHIIGRTSWDYAHTKAINPYINYHFCNEIIRDSFYTATKWDVNCKNDYTVFISQAIYPIKGLHQVLKAIALLRTDFPEIIARIAGPNIIKNKSFMGRIKLGGYGAYIKNMIDRFNLHEQVWFTGSLLEEQMVAEYRNAHVFICPSSIENSPNSLGEAQLLGVPTIASYVGGIPDMVVHGESGLLYRFEEVEMLAENIRKIFTNDLLAIQLSKNGIHAAAKRHNRQINLKQTLSIYNKVLLFSIKS
jgi:glycosyltransferase involved in cell wall biosynthesis